MKNLHLVVNNKMLQCVCSNGKRVSMVFQTQKQPRQSCHLSAILLRVMRSRGVLLMASVISEDQPCTVSRQSRLHSCGSVTRSSCTAGHLTRWPTHSLTV